MNETLWERQVPPRAPSTASDVWRDDVLSPAGITVSRSLLRRHVTATSLPPGVDDDDVDVLLLAYEELASNAIWHGRPPVHVTVTAMDDGWLIDVVDGAAECAPAPSVGRDPAHGGLGLQLVARLCPTHGWWTEANCKHVWARVRSTTAPHVPAGKLVVPELPAEFAPRPRLRQLLDEASTDQVIVVSAPGGSGKTLLVADWVRSGEGPETAWISLGRDDNDPRRLWEAVVTALLAVPSVAADHRLQRLLSHVTRQRNADVVGALAAALDVLDPPVRLVLDDVHELIGPEVLRDLARLVRLQPEPGNGDRRVPTAGQVHAYAGRL